MAVVADVSASRSRRSWLIAGGLCGSRSSGGSCLLSRFSSSTLGFLLSAAGSFFGLTLGLFLGGALRGFLLGAHLLFSSTACLLFGLTLRLLLRTLHFSLLLAPRTFLSLALRHFLGTLCFSFLLAACLLLGPALCHFLRTLRFSFLLTARLLLSLALLPLLRASLGLLLGTHLLLFSGTADRFLLLALHGGSLGLLSACGSHSSLFLFGSHAFSGGTLLLSCPLLLLLLRGLSFLLLRSGGLHAGLFHFSGCGGLIRSRFFCLRLGVRFLLACFFRLGCSLIGHHALLLGGLNLLLLCSGGLHAGVFRFSSHCALISGHLFRLSMRFCSLLSALLHRCGLGLLLGSQQTCFLGSGCMSNRGVSHHCFCCH